MKSLGLVSCSNRKQDYPCKASAMYSASDLFRKAYAYCTKNYDQVAILSAKYGLVFPEDVIEPYDLSLNEMRTREIRRWSEQVFKQMKKKLNLYNFDRVHFHAGERYRQYLIPMIERLGLKCEVPLKNLSIGKQLKWYNAHLKNTCEVGHNMPKPSFGEVWKRILACEGEEFKTATYLPFTYEVRGEYLRPSRTEYNISKSDFKKAYAIVPIDGPGKITKLVRGPSYVWAILHDERISNNEW